MFGQLTRSQIEEADDIHSADYGSRDFHVIHKTLQSFFYFATYMPRERVVAKLEAYRSFSSRAMGDLRSRRTRVIYPRSWLPRGVGSSHRARSQLTIIES